jgi:hypothetical protein
MLPNRCETKTLLWPNAAIGLFGLSTMFVPLDICCGQKALAEETVNAVVLEQKTQTSGSLKVFYGPQALRVDFKKLDCCLVSRAPVWKIFIFNKRKKVYHQTDFKHYRGLVKDRLFSMWESLTARTWVDCGRDKVAGVEVNQFRVRSRDRELTEAERQAVMYLAHNLKVAPMAANIMCKTVLAPPMGRVPIACDISRSMFGEQSTRFLSTLRVERQKVSNRMFDLPAGLRLVKDDSVVTIDGSSEGVEQLLF